ncbi:MAG: hypothetical protein AABY22_14290 [Nanoarchaeota archaeon]
MTKENIKDKGGFIEFLMTYGFAIIATIIAIGILAFLGVFNFSKTSDISVSASNITLWNQTYDKKLELACDKPDEILYIYFNNSCRENNVGNILRKCVSEIACDKKGDGK